MLTFQLKNMGDLSSTLDRACLAVGSFNYAYGEDNQAVALADLNGDGKLDIVAASRWGTSHSVGNLTVLLNTCSPQ